MKKVIIGIGIPGSGKTTVLRDFADKYGYTYVCPDDIRQELTGDAQDQTRNREVWSEAYNRAGALLDQGETVVFDATFTDQRTREQVVKFAREHGVDKVQALHLDIPIEVAKERNASRELVVPEYAIDRMHGNLEKDPPSVEEGFDGVFTLDELHELTDAEVRTEAGILHRHRK